jgi:PST family polysaccharide transporter
MEIAKKNEQECLKYRSILKSTSLIGGASIFNILIGMVRTKFVAVLLGPAGVGLLGMYGQITSLISAVTGMGISSSGVRQVAEAVSSHDHGRIARTVKTLRRTAWLTGILGLLIMTVFCVPLSRVTFGANDYSLHIAALGITMLTGAIAAGQGCIINGTRRIGDLARISVMGSFSGTIISIPLYYYFGQEGIVPSLILSSFASLATSWWFARRVPILPHDMSWRESYGEARQLIAFGASIMGAGLVLALSGYLIRLVMLRQFSLYDVGIYQAAFSLSGILVGFVLNAMGADYYPRLTAVARDNESVHRMVNEQSQISILLALPGLAAMMVFAPLIIKLFYSSYFIKAVPILHWCILGMLGRVFSWPLGFIVLAKGQGKIFFFTEALASGLHLAAVYLLIRIWGLVGAGMAFMVLYVVYTGMMLAVMHRMVGATWNSHTVTLVLLATITTVLLMLNCSFNENMLVGWTVNFTVITAVSLLCYRQLSEKAGIDIRGLITRYLK